MFYYMKKLLEKGWVKYKLYFFIICVAILAIYFYGKIDYTKEEFRNWDSHQYVKMAKAVPKIDDTIPRPFSFRLLGPYLIGLLTDQYEIGFYIFNVMASIFFIIIFLEFLCYFKIRRSIASIIIIFYILNKHFFGFTSWNFFHINDVLMNIIFIILFWSLLEGRWVIYTVALLLGSVTREPFLIIIPVTFFYLIENKKFRKHALRLILYILPAIICFLLIRIYITPTSGLMLSDAFYRFSDKIFNMRGLFKFFINPFVPLSLIPIIYYEKTILFFKEHKYMILYVILVFFSALFGSNYERLAHPSFIVFYLLIAVIIQESNLNKKRIITTLLIFTYLSSLHYLIGRFKLPDRNTTIILSGGSFILVTIVIFIYRMIMNRKLPTIIEA